jgi:hypothetical protein
MADALEQHVTRFLLAWRQEVVRAVWGLLRAALIAFLTVLIIGGGVVTFALYNYGMRPFQPLALLVYAMLIVAALATAAMTASLYFSLAVLRGIESAGRKIVQEARYFEGEVMHTIAGGARLPDEHERRLDR